MVASRTRRLSARNISIVVLVLVVIYAIAGFVALPWWLEKTIPQRLEQHLGWQADVADIRVNPFVMSIDASSLEAADSEGEPVLAFESLYANLGFWRLVTGVVALQNIELEDPFVRVDLLQDYGVNFARDWQANNPPPDQPAADDAEGGAPPRLHFDRVRVSGGQLLFRDFSQQELEEFRVEPLDLAINDLATWPREVSDSNYYLLAAVGSQTIEWEGDLSIFPLYSKGFLRLGEVTHTTLQHFLKPYLPYHLRDGRVTLSTEYELRSADELLLSTSDGELTVEGLALGLEAGSGDELLDVNRLTVGDISFGLNSRQASTGTVSIDGADLSLHRDPDGVINLLRPFRESDEAEQGDSSGGGLPFRWAVAGVELGSSRVSWRDEQLESAAELSLQDLGIRVGELSHQLEDPINYQASATLGDGGRLTFNGQTTLSPFTLEAGISGAEIALAQFGAYINEAANLDVREGHLNFDGNLDLDQQQDPLTGTFSGKGEVASLDLRLGDSDERLIGWENLRLEPVEYNVSPARLQIGTITLMGPAVNLVREGDGSHNLERIVRSSGQESSEQPAADDSGGKGDEEPSFIFRIGQVMLEEGKVAYTDRTLDPAFATRFDQLRGSVTGLSNVAPQQGKVSIQGRVGDVSRMAFEGTVGTLGTDDTSNLTLSMEEVSLPMLSPYFGRYLGYSVDSGKLNLEMDYELTGTRLNAGNQVVLDRLELGGAVASDQAISAPVRLGLALLRDSDGVIEIDLPVSGNLEDPDFRIGHVVMRAFVNVVAKAATSPFSVLGSIADMAGLSGEELGMVGFEPGKVELAEGENVKLEALAKALKERPKLLLNIRGAVAPETDGEALQREQEEAGAELPADALGNLASSRGIWLRRQMLDQYEVPESQLYLQDPARNASANEDGKVMIQLVLDAR